ncbi:hypothetical protein DRQ25_08115 [Candidatus Fermentibacteria bacterium]|nr:MAG: hypothetical protein DRQ25_08115 [Candidatus Fermentibacteria bacterium]
MDENELSEREKVTREALARVSHEIWAHWMRYMFSVCDGNVEFSDGILIPFDKFMRWSRQMNTDYADLTEREKDSDREQADKIMLALKAML